MRKPAGSLKQKKAEWDAMTVMTRRLTSYAHGGGCACKIAPGELERMVAGLLVAPPANAEARLVAGRDDGDDAAVVSLTAAGDVAVISTVDFFAPVVDDPFDWGRIAAGAVWATDAGAIPGAPVIGELVQRGEYVPEIR
jgi:selenide,water dikinase